MERNRIIAIACAVIATLLVVIAGKSCTDDAVKQKKNRVSNNKNAYQEYTHGVEVVASETTEAVTFETDVLGRPISETTTAAAVEYDLFGRPVTTAPQGTDSTDAVTDENGSTVVSAPVTDNSTDTSDISTGTETATVASDQTSSETSSPASTAPPKISGFNHGEYDDEGNLKPTLPPDFAIIIT